MQVLPEARDVPVQLTDTMGELTVGMVQGLAADRGGEHRWVWADVRGGKKVENLSKAASEVAAREQWALPRRRGWVARQGYDPLQNGCSS